jgi:membrane associated rhomboid family serine protease
MFRKGQFGLPLGDQNPVERFPFVNWIIIAINVLVFIFSLAAFEYVIGEYGFKPGAIQFSDIIASMFLHGGIAHIFGNMWFLYIFGDNVEDRLGHLMYILFYFLAGIAATLSHLITNLGSLVPAVGASGAISGVLGAYMIFFPTAGVYVSGGIGHRGLVSAKMMIGLWFVFQFISGVLGYFGTESGVAFWAHVGGFIFGVLFAWIWKRASPQKRSLTHS